MQGGVRGANALPGPLPDVHRPSRSSPPNGPARQLESSAIAGASGNLLITADVIMGTHESFFRTSVRSAANRGGADVPVERASVSHHQGRGRTRAALVARVFAGRAHADHREG